MPRDCPVVERLHVHQASLLARLRAHTALPRPRILLSSPSDHTLRPISQSTSQKSPVPIEAPRREPDCGPLSRRRHRKPRQPPHHPTPLSGRQKPPGLPQTLTANASRGDCGPLSRRRHRKPKQPPHHPTPLSGRQKPPGLPQTLTANASRGDCGPLSPKTPPEAQTTSSPPTRTHKHLRRITSRFLDLPFMRKP